MAFLESPRFPDAVSYGCQGGPTWQTAVIAVASGHEARNQIWSAARHRYDVSHVYHQNDGGKLALLRSCVAAISSACACVISPMGIRFFPAPW